jgi:hypothetical protein
VERARKPVPVFAVGRVLREPEGEAWGAVTRKCRNGTGFEVEILPGRRVDHHRKGDIVIWN